MDNFLVYILKQVIINYYVNILVKAWFLVPIRVLYDRL